MSEKELEIAQKLGVLLRTMTETERAYTLGFLDGLQVAKINKEGDKDEKTDKPSEK